MCRVGVLVLALSPVVAYPCDKQVVVTTHDVALLEALTRALAEDDVEVVAPGAPCAALEVVATHEAGGIRLTPVGGAGQVYVAGPLALQAALVGGVRWTKAITRGEGCRPPEPCTRSEASPTVDVVQHTGPYGELSLGLQLLTGDDWGFDVACTFALGEAVEDQLGAVISRPLTLRPGVGVRVALP